MALIRHRSNAPDGYGKAPKNQKATAGLVSQKWPTETIHRTVAHGILIP